MSGKNVRCGHHIVKLNITDDPDIYGFLLQNKQKKHLFRGIIISLRRPDNL